MSTSNRVELKQTLTRIFRHYTLSPPGNTCCGSQTFLSVSTKSVSESGTNTHLQLTDATLYRPLFLVGHDLESGLRCLRRVDFDPDTVAPFVAFLDSRKIAYALYSRPFRLSSLCWHFDIKVKRSHHSGNDAAYTLLALLRMAAETSDYASTENIQGINFCVLAGPERVRTVTPSDWADNLSSLDATNI